MKYIDGFRDPKAAKVIRDRIAELAEELAPIDGETRIMEVCGTHTMAIARYGIRTILPESVELISEPGCPVCVTDTGYIDAAIKLAKRKMIIASFGDMLKVPGSASSLAQCRSEGATIEVCYSPLKAFELAANYPDREVVFLAIGFETTIGPVISIVEKAIADGVRNISLLTAFKTVPPALHSLASDPEIRIDAFLCPAHVSAIIGADAYQSIVDSYQLPCVIAGFEPLDILLGLAGIMKQLLERTPRVENQYCRVVKPQGNLRALALLDKYLRPVDAAWRGAGIIARSGLGLRPEFEEYDAEVRHGIDIRPAKVASACRCGDVLKGIIKPFDCAMFGRDCTPENPVGPCMVSSEGSCSAYYKFAQAESL